jgi:hypothetical protein
LQRYKILAKGRIELTAYLTDSNELIVSTS